MVVGITFGMGVVYEDDGMVQLLALDESLALLPLPCYHGAITSPNHMSNTSKPCKHPANRIYSWFAPEYVGGPKILCAVCCDCRTVLAGGVECESASAILA